MNDERFPGMINDFAYSDLEFPDQITVQCVNSIANKNIFSIIDEQEP